MVQQFNMMKIEPFIKKVSPSDELFVNHFFRDSDIIFNALDNLSAFQVMRQYHLNICHCLKWYQQVTPAIFHSY